MARYPGEMTDENIRKIFENAADFNYRPAQCGKFTLYTYAIDGLTAGANASEYIFRPITDHLRAESMQALYDAALDGMIYNSVARECKDLDTVALMLVNGFCVVLFPGAGAIAFEVKTPEKRGISAPELEHTAKGAKDAFVETNRTNTSLIRRHLRTPNLRLYETQVGQHSITNVTVAWIDGVTDMELVARMKKRLDTMRTDGLVTPAAVEELITGGRSTAFPLLQYTERADRFCEGLLAGRVGVIVDGIPLGYLAPVDVGVLMQSPEDWGKDYVSASAIRVLRYGALLLSLLLPGLFIAMATFHQEMIPLQLLRAMIKSKESVPFSTTLEVLMLLLAFEILQESGVHLPPSIGQSVSIIGGIVVGTAAVEAKFISPAALIIVSVAGVCGYVLPNRDLADGIRVWRFVLAALSAIAGLFGWTVGLLLLVIHLSSLTSLDTPYLKPFSAGKKPLLLRRLKKQR
ncbi:MAG: spore germination protein [Ruminococcaceae bacterium]|nr:spore germination protein [Oscillospiraceae bacterium]